MHFPPLRALHLSRMENDQDEFDDLTQDFARFYTEVERETRQEAMYRDAAVHGRTPRQDLPEREQELVDHNAHHDVRVLEYQAERGDQGFQAPPTEARRNITSRRSRGRNEELSKEPAVLMTKRPKSRPQDDKYRRESVGDKPKRILGRPLPGPEMLRRCKERMSAEM